MDEYEEAVLFTFALLESRLERLEYLLSGPNKTFDEKPKTIPDRIHRIEKSLQELAGKTSLLKDAQELSMLWFWFKVDLTRANDCSNQTQGRPRS